MLNFNKIYDKITNGGFLWKENIISYLRYYVVYYMKDKNEEQKYIESLVTLGKKIALEASQDKELEKKIKKSSNY